MATKGHVYKNNLKQIKIYTPSGTKSNKIVDLLNHQQPPPEIE